MICISGSISIAEKRQRICYQLVRHVKGDVVHVCKTRNQYLYHGLAEKIGETLRLSERTVEGIRSREYHSLFEPISEAFERKHLLTHFPYPFNAEYWDLNITQPQNTFVPPSIYEAIALANNKAPFSKGTSSIPCSV